MSEAKEGKRETELEGSAWVGREWWVFRPAIRGEVGLWVGYAGPFLSKTLADEWIAKQSEWPKGLRAGRKAVVWTATPNEKGQR